MESLLRQLGVIEAVFQHTATVKPLTSVTSTQAGDADNFDSHLQRCIWVAQLLMHCYQAIRW